MKYVGVKHTGELRVLETQNPDTDDVYLVVEPNTLGAVPFKPFEFVHWTGSAWEKVTDVQLATTIDVNKAFDEIEALIPEGASEDNKLATASDVAGVQEDVDTIEGKIPSDTSTTNKLVNESGLQDAIDNASESWSTGFTPKGESSVSDLNGLATQSNGDSYIVTDSGTLTDGSIAVVAGEQVAWDATNSVWYKLPQYALKSYVDTISNNFAGKFDSDKVGGYKKNEFVVYQGGMYRFNADHSGAWTGLDVTAVNLGTLINQLNTQSGDLVNAFFEETPNIFAGINSSLLGYYGSDGTFCQNNSYRVTNPVLLSPNTEYKVTYRTELGFNHCVFLCDKDGNVEKAINAELSDGLLVFTHDRAQYGYAVFNYGYPSSPDFMVGRSSTFPAEYTAPEGWVLKVPYPAENLVGVISMDRLPPVVANNGVVIKHSPNLYDASDLSGCISNYYIAAAGYTSGNNYHITQPIYVEGGITYKAIHGEGLGSNFKYALLNDDFSYKRDADGSNDSGDTSYIVFTPSQSGWIRLNLGKGNLSDLANSFILAKYSDYPDHYVAFGRDIADDIGLGTKQKQQVADISSAPNLVGKKISLNGDSICAGAGFSGGYGKIIADMFGMAYENVGVGGGTIQAETYYSGSGNPRHWICRTISSMSTDADYIVLEGGVNDDVTSSMGSMTSGYDEVLDDTTFYGAFESMLKQALIRFPGKKIGYIAVHKMDAFDSRYTDPATSKYLAAKLCCEKWGIPFLDLNTTVPPFARFPDTGDLYTNLKAAYTYNADGWHPNEDGYKKFYVPKIVAWLNAL